jgi:hypothetical protein
MSVFSPDVNITNVPLPVDGSGFTQPVSGTIAVSNFPATQPVSGPLTDAQLRASPVPVTGAFTNNASTATISQVTTNNVNQVLLAANANRKKAIVFSAGGKTLIALGSAASSTNFTYNLTATNQTLEITGWTGSIQAIQSGGTSLVTFTELV